MNTEETIDTGLVARVATALDATLSASPSAAASVAIAAAARKRARAVRLRRRIQFALPLAACLAIVAGALWQSPPPATQDFDGVYAEDEYEDYYYECDDPLLAIVELDTEDSAEMPQFTSPFALFTYSLMAMQDYPSDNLDL